MKATGYIMNHAVKFIKNIVLGLFGAILLFLFVISVIGTCTINSDEIVSYQNDNPFWHIAVLGMACLIGTVLMKRFRRQIRPKYFYLALGVLLFTLVCFTQLWPKGDSGILLEIAEHIGSGNYQDFLPGGYLYNQPHQIPLAYLCSILYLVFGRNYVFVYQAANCFFTVGVLYLLQKLYRRFKGELPVGGFLAVSFLFVPFLFYVTFVYGTTPGLFLALAACVQLTKYMDSGKLFHAAFCIVLLVAAKMLKSNYLIFAVAFAAILFYDFLRKANLRHAAVIVVLAASVAVSGIGVKVFTQHQTNIISNGGIPYILFVAMGFQEGTLAPGWWSGYHTMVFENMRYDVKKAAECGKENLLERLQVMKEDPAYGADFMYRKLSSEWSEPTYESIWIQQNRASNIRLARPLENLFSGGGRLSGAYVMFCNFFQTFLYFFSLLFVIGKWKKITASEMLLPVIFIGGFLFHIFWEAKGQYTLPYCVCLMPMCVWGYGYALKAVSRISFASSK